MQKEVKEYFNKLRKKDEYNYFLMRKLYSKHKDVLNYNNIDNIEYEDFFKPYICNNNLLEFLEVSFDDFDFRKSLSYYELKTIYTIIYMSEIKCKESYNYELSSNIKEMLKYYIKFKRLLEIEPIEDRKKFIKRIVEDDYNNPGSCVLYSYDIDHYKIVNSVVCDNEFLKIIQEKFLNVDIHSSILKKIIEILELSINIYNDYNLGIKNNKYFEYIKEDKIKIYNIELAEEYLKLLKRNLKNNKIAILKNY